MKPLLAIPAWFIVLFFSFFLGPATMRAGPALIASNSDFAVATWRSEDGLPHDNVSCLLQTRDGYLWIGTPMGLARFDGVKFVNYSGRDFPALTVNRVTSLLEGRDGSIWIALESGSLLVYRNGIFESRVVSKSSGESIVAMAEDAQGTLWLQSAGGVLSYVDEKMDQTQIVPRILISALISDAHHQIWVSTRTGLKIVQDKVPANPSGAEPILERRLNSLFPAQGDFIWAVQDQKLLQVLQGKVHKSSEIPAEFGQVNTAVEASDKRLWIGTTSGRLLCRETSGQLHVIGPEDGIRGNVAALLEDREGNIWCGSYGGGLSRIRPRAFKWHPLSLPNGTSAYAFNVCSDASGNVWTRFENNVLAMIRPGEDVPLVQKAFAIPASIRALYCDRAQTLWLGAEGGYLYQMGGGQINPVVKVGENVSFISAIFEDSRSNVWVGFTGGAGVGVLEGGLPSKWKTLTNFPTKDVRAIAEANDGSLWFGTYYGGAVQFKNGQYTTFTTRDGLPSDYVRCLLAGPDGTVWMGTLRGICGYRGQALHPISSRDGLWNDAISFMIEDGVGNFWISSFGGVFRVAKQELNNFADGRTSAVQCIGYNRNDGLPALECPGGFQPAGALTPNGRAWFPTEAGLVSIDTRNVFFNSNVPPVRIEKFLVENVSQPVAAGKAYEIIAPGKHHLEFQFTALSFVSPEKVRFSHQLEGVDSDWSVPDERRRISYDFLPAGKYVFKVKACNNDGVWNPTAATLSLFIQPFFWQTSWFITSVALAIAVALFFTVRQWERRKLGQRLEHMERQQAVARDRARIAKDIHDDAGATLAQIAFLSERIENSRQLEEISALNRRIESAARQTIQSIDEIVWAVSPKHDTLESLANYLSSFMQEHLELAGIRCVLDVLPVLEPRTVGAEIRHNILLTAREALQNAVSHARATVISMSLDFRENLLAIVIADDGTGFEIDKLKSRGNGLTNMRKRLEEIGGKLEIQSAPGDGTKVYFSILIEPMPNQESNRS